MLITTEAEGVRVGISRPGFAADAVVCTFKGLAQGFHLLYQINQDNLVSSQIIVSFGPSATRGHKIPSPFIFPPLSDTMPLPYSCLLLSQRKSSRSSIHLSAILLLDLTDSRMFFWEQICIQVSNYYSKHMVLLHYKKTDHNQFLFQTTGDQLVGDIIVQLVQINNTRIKLDNLACALEDLATHGPLKPEQIRGLTDQELIDNALVVASEEKKKWGQAREPQGDERFNEDKTQYRIGVIKNEGLTKMMIQTSNKAKKLVSYKMVDEKLILTLKMLQDVWEELKAALFIAYPNYEGLGEWEPAAMICNNDYIWENINTNQIDYLDPKNSSMWWAGKELLPEKPLNSYTGKNEKTKILVKLTKSGSGAPVREAAVDEETRIKLMGMYHKKQEELKKIESHNEDDFTNSTWANPNNLKNQLVTGGKGVGFKNLK